MQAPAARRQVGWQPSTPALARAELVDSVPSDLPPATMAELVEKYGAILLRRAERLCRNHETAKDLVQETFVRALQHIDQLEPGTHPGAWLSKILTRLFLDHLKHQNVERNAVPALVALREITYDWPLETVTDAALLAAIAALDPELRQVVELCYLQQLRYRDVAAQLDVPVGTVGTRLMRARARLRELLTLTSQKS